MTKGMRIVGSIAMTAVAIVLLVVGVNAWEASTHYQGGTGLGGALLIILDILLVAGWIMFVLWDHARQKAGRK